MSGGPISAASCLSNYCSAEETSQRWPAVSDTASDMTNPGIEPKISHTDNNVLITELTGRLQSYNLILIQRRGITTRTLDMDFSISLFLIKKRRKLANWKTSTVWSRFAIARSMRMWKKLSEIINMKHSSKIAM